MKISHRFMKNHPWSGLTFAFCAAVVLYLFLSHLGSIFGGIGKIFSIFYPVWLGLIIAYVIDPLAKLFQRLFTRFHVHRYNRVISVIVALSVLIVFIVILLFALIPQLIESIANLVNNADTYLKSLQSLLQSANESFSESRVGETVDISGAIQSVEDFASEITQYLTSNIGQILNTSYNIGTNIADWILGFILAIYFLMDKTRLQKTTARFFRAILPSRSYDPFSHFIKRCNAILVRFIACELLDSLIVGFANYTVMKIAGMPYPSLISVLVGVTNLAPTFGPVVGGALGAFILVLTDPWAALGFLILTLVLQILDGYVVKPKLYGNQLGVPSVLILISIIVGSRALGIPGILLAIPFSAILTFLYSDYILPRLEKKNLLDKARKDIQDLREEMAEEDPDKIPESK